MKEIKKIIALILTLVLMTAVSSCAGAEDSSEKNGEVYILFTSDVHCGIDQGFGYTGVQQVRASLQAQGYEVILVDNGDSIQGEAIGLLSRGETILDLMNDMHYDVAIPGNHEFDYGVDRFLELAEKAEFPYISCNFTHNDELVFEPYVIKEAGGVKIAFVGVTTPETLTSSMPKNFQNDKGEYVYGFMQDETGEKLYESVQKAVDSARAEGADLVYVMGHVGYLAYSSPYSYDDIIQNTNGIDVFLDGHSHDTEQVVMKNKDGDPVVRSACGAKLGAIGYSRISADGQVAETNIWTWNNSISAPVLMGIDNDMTDKVAAAKAELEEQLGTVVAESEVKLTIFYPGETDSDGKPIRMVRRAETNLGDLAADAFREKTGADIALVGGGGIRTEIQQGEITYGNMVDVHPFNNDIVVIEATGQQILDALEWSVHLMPGENGGFLQVSGMSFEVDPNIPSGCYADTNGMMAGIEGPRRVSNVMIGGEPLDPAKRYTIVGPDFVLINNGDGQTAFNGAKVLSLSEGTDTQLLIEYVTVTLEGKVGTGYEDPYGQGRITVRKE